MSSVRVRATGGARAVSVEFADRRGEVHGYQATIPEVSASTETVAYSYGDTIVRSDGTRLLIPWRRQSGNRFALDGDPVAPSDDFLAAVLTQAADDLHGMSDLVITTQLQHAANRFAIVDGNLWQVCGEPVYSIVTADNDGVLAQFNLPRTVTASVGVVHSPGIPVIGDQDFAADRYEDAVATFRDWAHRGYQPRIEGRGRQQVAKLPRIQVTGLHQPGSTWKAEGLLSMPSPANLDRAELAEAVNTMHLRLRLLHAMPDPRGRLDDLDPSRLSALQVAVVDSYRARAGELGMAIGSSSWLPPLEAYRARRRR